MQINVVNIDDGHHELIHGNQPFICNVVPGPMYTAPIKGNMSSIAGMEFALTLFGQDVFENSVSFKSDIIWVILNHYESNISQFAQHLDQNMYISSFILTKSGDYSLLVKINNNSFVQSSFFVICKPQEKSSALLSGLKVTQNERRTADDSTTGTTGAWVT
jgi:hypothetical protein